MRSGHPLWATVAAAFCALFLVLGGGHPVRGASDPFYLELLRDGTHAYDRGDYPAAVRNLRFACFGMLDDPKELAACLVRLALAQDKAADMTGFRETFVRLVELEDRFQGYSKADLPPEIRTTLEQRMAAQIPAPTLESSPPAFRALLARKPGAPAPARPAQPPEHQAAGKPREAPTATPPVKPATRAGGDLPIQRQIPPPAAGPRPLSDEEKAKLETARKLLGETAKGKDLRQAFQLAREVADAHPEGVEAQRLTGEAAYRASLWSDAASYLQRGGGLPDSEPELLFYLAVALYESGDRPGAAAALRRSLPNLQRTPFIDAYTRKILGR